MQRRHFLGDLSVRAMAIAATATLTISIAAAQNTTQALQTASSPSVAQDTKQGLLIALAPTAAIWAAVIASLMTMIGNIIAVRSQRRATDKQIAAQQKNLEAQFKNALMSQSQQDERERTKSKEEEENKTLGLVIATAIEVISIVARTEVYADQAAQYTELTEYNIERLRIDIPSSLNLDPQYLYLFRAPQALGEIKVLTTMVERANRRLDQLKSLLVQQPAVKAEKIQAHLKDLAGLYEKCAESGKQTIDTLETSFPKLKDMINEADKTIRLPTPPRTVRRGTIQDGRMTSSTSFPNPFSPEISP